MTFQSKVSGLHLFTHDFVYRYLCTLSVYPFLHSFILTSNMLRIYVVKQNGKLRHVFIYAQNEALFVPHKNNLNSLTFSG